MSAANGANKPRAAREISLCKFPGEAEFPKNQTAFADARNVIGTSVSKPDCICIVGADYLDGGEMEAASTPGNSSGFGRGAVS